MIASVLFTHSILIKVFLGFLVGGAFLPLMTHSNPQSLKKVSFFYTLIFQGLITMIAFAGLIATILGDFEINIAIGLMIIIWIIMMVIEIKKHKLIKVANLQNEETARKLRNAFYKISAIQIALIAIMVVLMVLKAKGVVSL